MNKKDSIQYLNKLGENNTPCFFIIDYEMKNTQIWELNEIPKNVFISFPNFSNCIKTPLQTHIDIKKKPIDFETYKTSFYKVQKHLQRGNSFLVNLTAESSIFSDASIYEIFKSSYAPYCFAIENEFVVFSPEPFMKITDSKIQTFPMKGTINANIPDAEHIILSNNKEKAEHATIVDLLRNDMSMIANQVTIEKYRYIDTITSNSDSLLQVSSCIRGIVKDEFKSKIGSIIFKMLPAGSICGAPKPKTLEIIKEVETHTRGFYTGIMGYFDGNNLESAVMIRYIEKRNENYYYKSGGGITTQSNVEDEYNELIQKIYVPTH